VLLSPNLVDVKKLIDIDGPIEVETPVVLDQLALLVIVVDSIDLKHHDVGWSANPSLQDFNLAFFLSFPAFDF
jgi:hypothetical protein